MNTTTDIVTMPPVQTDGAALLQETLNSIFKQPLKLVSNTKINKRTVFDIRRLELELSSGATPSVVVKHMPFNSGFYQGKTCCHPGLLQEIAAYRLLMHCREEFSFFPKLLARANGLLVLEDLGKDDFDFPTEEKAQKALIKSLAGLHTVTAGKQQLYNDLRAATNSWEGEYHVLPFHDTAKHFEAGIDYVMNSLGLAVMPRNVTKDINSVRELVEKPGRFHTLLHNDLVARRQAVVRHKQFFLLDFEHSNFGHALLDFWLLYVGKIEYNTQKGIYFRKNLRYIPGMDHAYTKAFERFSGLSLDEQLWKKHFSGVLIYAVMAMVGQLICMPGYLKEYRVSLAPMHPLATELQVLLKFLTGQLKANNTFAALGEMAARKDREI